MLHAIKSTLGLIHVCLCFGLMLALVSPLGAQQPVKIEADGEGVWRLTTTLMGQADRLQWAAEMEEQPDIGWQNNQGFIDIQWVVRSDDRPSLSTWVLMRSVDGQTEWVELTVNPAWEVIGPVGAGMTLWRIGSEWLAAWDDESAEAGAGDARPSPPPMSEWLDQVMRANPQAFETDQPNSLMRGAMLRHPIDRALDDGLSDGAGAAVRSISSETLIKEVDWVVPTSTEDLGQDAVDAAAVGQEALSREQGSRVEGLDEAVQARTLSSIPASTPDDSQAAIASGDLVGQSDAQPSWFAFDFIGQPQWWQQPQQLGRVVLAVGLVVIGVMILQIFSKVYGVGRLGEEGSMHGSVSINEQPTHMTSEAVSVTLGLAQRYVQLGEITQALHWIDEVLAHGSPKQIREAKRLRRDALATWNHGHE